MISLVGSKMISSTEDGKSGVGLKSIMEGVLLALKYPVNLVRSSLIGMVIGILPGAGVSTSALMAYSQAQTWSKDSKSFGHGNPEGVIAPEAANNACAPGAVVPAMALGIPGSGTVAVLLAALTLQGVTPGPRVMQDFPDEVFAVFVALLVSTVFMFIFGIFYTAWVSHLASVNMAYIIPGVMVICVVGSFATRGFMFDAYVFFVLGLVGVIMIANGFQYAPIMLGIVMGRLCEDNFLIAMNISKNDYIGVCRPRPFGKNLPERYCKMKKHIVIWR
jgi:putative tricarboxylic transport membrane protein